MQHQLLLAIRGHRGAAGPTISDVAGYLIVRHHSAVQLVDRAEAGRLVHRVPDERDGRVVRLALSREGARRLEALAAATKEELARVGPRLAGLWTPSMSRRFRPHVLSGIRTRLLRLRDTGYLKKWLILGGLIGIVAGLGAVVFITALEAATGLFLESLGGYTPPSPIGEGNAAGSAGFDRPWAIPLVVALGGLISGILTVRFAPEAEGHGTDAAIEAFHHNPGGVRSRVVGVKLAASAITIGSEGSAGREGPTAQISAGFGSLLGRVLELSPTDARIAVARRHRLGHRRHLPGAAWRGGARRRDPLPRRHRRGGHHALPRRLGHRLLHLGAFEGFTPIFGFLRGYRFDHPVQLFYFALLGLAAGAMGRLYSRSFHGVMGLSRRSPAAPSSSPPWLACSWACSVSPSPGLSAPATASCKRR